MKFQDFFPKDKVYWEITKIVVFSLLPSIFYFIFPELKARLNTYDLTFLICFGSSFIGIFVYDIITQRSNVARKSVGITYALILILFLAITNWTSDEVLRGHLPMLFVFVALLIVKIVHLSKVNFENHSKNQIRKDIGFAATGVLINIGNSDDPKIILIFNKNLRKGKGLWVPPGGHFSLHTERADERLKSKILQEVGVNCTIFNPYPYNLPSRIDDIETNEVKWLQPPVFFLEENLMGKCSLEHEIHLDLIYLCITNGRIIEKKHKYDLNNRIEIPINQCLSSYDETEHLVNKLIDDWHLKHFGSKPSIRQDITKDVIWRLYLASKNFNEYYNRKKS